MAYNSVFVPHPYHVLCLSGSPSVHSLAVNNLVCCYTSCESWQPNCEKCHVYSGFGGSCNCGDIEEYLWFHIQVSDQTPLVINGNFSTEECHWCRTLLSGKFHGWVKIINSFKKGNKVLFTMRPILNTSFILLMLLSSCCIIACRNDWLLCHHLHYNFV